MSKELPITMEDKELPLFVEIVLIWVRNALIVVGIMALVVVAAGLWGYSSYKAAAPARPDKCINAACEKSCEDVKKFKRHEGCAP